LTADHLIINSAAPSSTS